MNKEEVALIIEALEDAVDNAGANYTDAKERYAMYRPKRVQAYFEEFMRAKEALRLFKREFAKL